MFRLERISDIYRSFVDQQIEKGWAGPYIVSKNTLHDTRTHEGLVAIEDAAVVGYILYNIDDGDCEITVLESLTEGRGIGTALLKEVQRIAKQADCHRVWLITTNDNTHAIRFYQRFGFDLRAVHTDSMDAARKLKPQIPLAGCDGIPIKHEFEFEIPCE